MTTDNDDSDIPEQIDKALDGLHSFSMGLMALADILQALADAVEGLDLDEDELEEKYVND